MACVYSDRSKALHWIIDVYKTSTEMPKEGDPVPPELAPLVSGYGSNGVARVDDHHV